MPLVTVPPSANGLPIAITQSPTRAWLAIAEVDERETARGALILSTARSDAGSVPTSLAGYSVPSVGGDGDLLDLALALSAVMTWLLVTT